MRTRLLLCLLFSLGYASSLLAGEIDQARGLQLIQKGDTLLIDVRSAEEFEGGALPGALNITHLEIAEQIATVAPDKNAPVVLYCRSGNRSGIAQETLEQLGYTQVINAGAFVSPQAEQQAALSGTECTVDC
jgi:phage shock protein E